MEISGRSRQLKAGSFNGRAVAYWMVRDKRASDNYALLKAQEIAITNQVPLYTIFQYNAKYETTNTRNYKFLFKGLIETEKELQNSNIPLFLLKGASETLIPSFLDKNFIGHLVVDYSPLKIHKLRLNRVLNKISIPVTQVDAHNIVPVWEVSNKKEYGAYTIRPKIKKKLSNYLTDIPKFIKHPYKEITKSHNRWEKSDEHLSLDHSVKEINWIKSGETEALLKLEILKTNLLGYDNDRNDPTKKAISNLSPYIHFGQISAQRIAYEIQRSNLSAIDKDAFLEQLIIRRELSENFCEYETNYDQFDGFHKWAQLTLNDHRNDEREYLYPLEQFESAETHDQLWNAAQREMVFNGKMHGYMRMYWAKKILEWTAKPEIALENAIFLNNKYELDGRDPNGYTGIAWSIVGIHDRPWFEREVYGKIRYMNYNGCKSKFNVLKYIEQNA